MSKYARFNVGLVNPTDSNDTYGLIVDVLDCECVFKAVNDAVADLNSKLTPDYNIGKVVFVCELEY